MGNWLTFSHDYARTGLSTDEVPILKSNVAALSPRWEKAIVDTTISSPLVDDGRLFIATLAGNVYAFDTATGNLIWRNYFASSGNHLITMTPTISDGLLFVGTHDEPSTFAAIDVATGAVRWQVQFPGYIRGEPVVDKGTVYIGEAGGDSPACLQGGLHALNELTGGLIWTWHVDPSAGDGGSQWGPISYDGSSVFVGTGNTCLSLLPTANALVRLNLSGVPEWSFTNVGSTLDSDFGAAPMLLNGNVYSQGKDGFFYALRASDGTMLWKRATGGIQQYGGIGSPTTDGTTLVVPTGSQVSPVTNPIPGSQLLGLDMQGNIKWSISTQFEVPGYAAIANGIAYVGLDNTLAAVDVTTGARLWSFTSPQLFYASPVVVSSGLYAIDEDGNLYAFDVASSAPTARLRTAAAHARIGHRRKHAPYRWTGTDLKD